MNAAPSFKLPSELRKASWMFEVQIIHISPSLLFSRNAALYSFTTPSLPQNFLGTCSRRCWIWPQNAVSSTAISNQWQAVLYTNSLTSTRLVVGSLTVDRLLVCRCKVGDPLHESDTLLASPDDDWDAHLCALRPSLMTFAHFSSNNLRNRSSSYITATHLRVQLQQTDVKLSNSTGQLV